MKAIENLLFDFGGVLVDLDMARCSRAFRSLGIDVTRILSHYVQSGIYLALERGETSFEACCDEIRRTQNVPWVSNEQIEWAWNAFLLDAPAERLDFLLELKQRYRLLLLSNTNDRHWRLAEDIYFRHNGLTVNDFFEHIFLSYRMHLEKPSAEIFQAVAREAGIDPAATLFIDDSAANCAASERCGFQSLTAPLDGGWMPLLRQRLEA